MVFNQLMHLKNLKLENKAISHPNSMRKRFY